MNEVLLGIKTDNSDSLNLLRKVVQGIAENFKILEVSSVYQVQGEHWDSSEIHNLREAIVFEGMVVSLRANTELSPEQAILEIKKIENQNLDAGRRTATIKLLIYESLTIMTPGLTLPHPDFHRKPEELVPAAEIWGEYIHPILKENIFTLTKKVSDLGWGRFYAQGKSLLDF